MILLLLLASAPNQIESRYLADDYESVVRLAPAYLSDSAATRADSIRVLQLYAYSEVALGDNLAAGRLFRHLLRLKPDLQLDSTLVSPKIRAVFAAVRQEFAESAKAPPAMRRDTVYLRRPNSSSVLVPGLSQLRSGRRVQGYALLGSCLASLVGAGITQVNYDRAHRAYIEATDPRVIQDRYRTANAWYRSRTVAISTAAVVWLCSVADGLINQ